MLTIATEVPLARYSTMRLGGSAAFAVAVSDAEQAAQACRWAMDRGLPFIVVGSGSNIVWRDVGFDGLLIVNRIGGYDEAMQPDGSVLMTAGAGENWDSIVERSVASGLTGIEAMSLVPGTAGATPVQNVGAYGQDVSQTLVSVQAYDSHTATMVSISNPECHFGYRASRFKSDDRGRFIITSVSFRLERGSIKPPYYRALQTYMDEHGITDTSPASIRQAVISIRSDKLPDPAKIANNGSFFANPIVSQETFDAIAQAYPELEVPHWPADAGIKLSAAWLLDQAGFKDYHDSGTGMATWHRQPLVLVNERASATAALLTFRDNIITTVADRFGVTLQQEPELLPVAA